MSYDERLTLNTHGYLEQRVNALRAEHELRHQRFEHWPVGPAVELATAHASLRSCDRYEALLLADGTAAYVVVDGGIAEVNAYGATTARAERMLEEVRERLPRAADSDPDLVAVTFWTYSIHGPRSIRRLIDAPAWSEIAVNYPGAQGLRELLHDWSPGVGGQLLLWHGDAGTGKTTALRSLGREWREWAELHYIVDPDRFFGDAASYMLEVMMGGDSERPIAQPGAGRRDEGNPWRVLVLEDCAEMLAPDARRDVGQALSRLLNACDGLIGRGLRLLILLTTNEPLEKVHPAISRPGRCATRIEFERFSAEQAGAWLSNAAGPTVPVSASVTLADLYALRDGHRSERVRAPVGFAAARGSE